jgi:DeoR/GlpR family transcriptional regulator of sugar metabolism
MLGVNTPITSIRRALNTLESQGKIEKVGRRIGNLDKKEFTYKLNLES